jgi:hypothetical protein
MGKMGYPLDPAPRKPGFSGTERLGWGCFEPLSRLADLP